MFKVNYGNDFEDVWNDGYTALLSAQTYSKIKGCECLIKEQRGSRWFTIAKTNDEDMVAMGKEKTYYYLPVDQYNQPRGYVEEVSATRAEYLILKHDRPYVFDNYVSAMYRAMD